MMLLNNGFAGGEGMPPSAKEGLELMEKAIMEDTKAAQHEIAVSKMKETEREIELLGMATKLARDQMARNMRSADFIGNIGYVCVRCKQHPHHCSC
jgi:hypothetical protein